MKHVGAVVAIGFASFFTFQAFDEHANLHSSQILQHPIQTRQMSYLDSSDHCIHQHATLV